MRLKQKADGSWEPHFTQVWEVEHLAELGDAWVPFALVDQSDAIGEIHAQTQIIRLHSGVVLTDRQVVVLQR